MWNSIDNKLAKISDVVAPKVEFTSQITGRPAHTVCDQNSDRVSKNDSCHTALCD